MKLSSLQKRTVKFSLLAICMIVLLGISDPVQTEYEVKAAFIYKLLKFIEWPDRIDIDNQKTIVIGIWGSSPIKEAFEALGKAQKDSSIQVVALQSLKEVNSVHVLFVSSSESQADLIDSLKGAKCLTIGESTDFARLGGMVNLMIKSASLKFELNAQAMRDSHYSVSSMVLKAAEKIW